jgi:GDSL-like Lipase/Acylhydrolase family
VTQSITDGTFSTINGNDRWSNDLSIRLHQAYGNKVSVVNEGIGGNTVVNPPQMGPAAVDRLDRDVLGLSGLTSVVWLEGINDFGAENNTVSAVIAGLQDGISRMHAAGIKVVGATITSSLNSTVLPNCGTPVTDAKRRATNDFIRNSGRYDSVADMDAATLDPWYWRAEAGVCARQQHREPWRQAPSQPRRLPKHGERCRS